MSYTNETTYYGLPLPTGSDKSTFTDNNTAFQAVDAALHTASEGAAQAALNITALTGRVGDCETNITNLGTDLGLEKAKIVNLQNKETLQDGEIRDVRSDCEDMICAYNEATSTSTHAYSAGDYFIYNDVLYVATDSIAVGGTIVPDTNCETTNVTTELKSQAGNIAQLNSELADRSYKILASVTADGVKTFGEVMHELYTQYSADFSRTVLISQSSVITSIYRYKAATSNAIIYTGFTTTANAVYLSEYSLGVTLAASKVEMTTIKVDTVNKADISSQVPEAGTVYKLAY